MTSQVLSDPQDVVVETLRCLASWGPPGEAEAWFVDAADRVEKADLAVDSCCPFCGEIDCDDDPPCPLRDLRGRHAAIPLGDALCWVCGEPLGDGPTIGTIDGIAHGDRDCAMFTGARMMW